MAAAKRKRELGPAARPKKRAKGAPTGSGPTAKAGPEGAAPEEYSIPAPVSQGKWKNKERVLIFSSRGINFRTRHLMQDLRTLMPHSKADTKMDRKDKLFVINEGPSAKFLVQNIHTLAELKMTGNCLRGSRPLLSFDPTFDKEPHYALLKELFIQIFSTPQYHPKSQPFVDHVFTFTITDKRIWFRNYQHRRLIRLSMAAKFREKHQVKEVQKIKKKESKMLIEEDPTEVVFETPAEEKPVEIQLVKPESKAIVKDKRKPRKIQRKKQKKLFRTEG